MKYSNKKIAALFLLAAGSLTYWQYGRKTDDIPVSHTVVKQETSTPAINRQSGHAFSYQEASNLDEEYQTQIEDEYPLTEEEKTFDDLPDDQKAQILHEKMMDENADTDMRRDARKNLQHLLSQNAGEDAEKLGFDGETLRADIASSALKDALSVLEKVSKDPSDKFAYHEIPQASFDIGSAKIAMQFDYKDSEGIHIRDPLQSPVGEEIRKLEEALNKQERQVAQIKVNELFRQAEDNLAQGNMYDYLDKLAEAIHASRDNRQLGNHEQLNETIRENSIILYEQLLDEALSLPKDDPHRLEILSKANRISTIGQRAGSEEFGKIWTEKLNEYKSLNNRGAYNETPTRGVINRFASWAKTLIT